MARADHAYCDGVPADDPRLSPLAADLPAGLAPALLYTAGFDPLRDEGEEYANRLRAEGNTVTLRRFPGYPHGFANVVGMGERLIGPIRETAAALRWSLAGRP
jgi:acetyl esterase